MKKIQNFEQYNIENEIIIELAKEIYYQQNIVNNIIKENKLLKKHIKKIEHSEESEQENSNKNSEENLQSPELPNNSNNLSDSQSFFNNLMGNCDDEQNIGKDCSVLPCKNNLECKNINNKHTCI
ncbi:3810_t:CDS:2 [Scutellospora calospora]|uniref:3810_t:CDS:1 n=1 Tax=Scutellospora calospora TaxID=85575 RepID=A0ACA9LFU4_9GLOM|nr:3810_t:CDS:2 [Scutellospora calospora]